MSADTTTPEQRDYFHTLRYLVAEAERPPDAATMRQELSRLYRRARREAKLQRLPFDAWVERQEQLPIELMDRQFIPAPDDLRMAADA